MNEMQITPIIDRRLDEAAGADVNDRLSFYEQFDLVPDGSQANPRFDLDQGSGSTGAAISRSSLGGISLTTNNTADDECAIVPSGGAGNLFGGLNFPANRLPRMRTQLVVSSLADLHVVAGFKKAWTGAIFVRDDEATDDLGGFFYFDPTESANWQVVTHDGTSRVNTVTDIPVVLNGTHKMAIDFIKDGDSGQRATFWIDGQVVASRNIAGGNLKPFAGVRTTTTAAKVITVRSLLSSMRTTAI